MVTTEINLLPRLKEVMKHIGDKADFIGVDPDKEELSSLAYMTEFGEPLLNMPASPFLIPAAYVIKGNAQVKRDLQNIFSLTGNETAKTLVALTNAGNLILDDAKDHVQEPIKSALEMEIK